MPPQQTETIRPPRPHPCKEDKSSLSPPFSCKEHKFGLVPLEQQPAFALVLCVRLSDCQIVSGKNFILL